MSKKLFRVAESNEELVENGITDENGVLQNAEEIERCRALFADIVPILETYPESTAAAVLSSLLGQNIAFVVKHSDATLETLVDRVTYAIKFAAERELSDDPDGTESRREN